MNSLPQPVQAVVALFEGPLAGVRFANVDAGGLTALAAEVDGAAQELARCEARLAELRQDLAQRQEAILSLAQQALAYARIYAETDAELLAQLNAITLPRAAKARKSATGKVTEVTEGEVEAAPSAEETSARVVPAVVDTGAVAQPEPSESESKARPRPKIQRRLRRAAS